MDLCISLISKTKRKYNKIRILAKLLQNVKKYKKTEISNILYTLYICEMYLFSLLKLHTTHPII